jgi:hypothetical protein
MGGLRCDCFDYETWLRFGNCNPCLALCLSLIIWHDSSSLIPALLRLLLNDEALAELGKSSCRKQGTKLTRGSDRNGDVCLEEALGDWDISSRQ